ncbi:DUF6193 family natural product biosynthesis protein [Streptosporangium sp. NPDC023825]|uniref:DUF6193 family natural product biosynthesis protein n=1 Tax=Streptosporangium sp. NPDC023825 TaxID=3154909 RepID=UPI00343C8360
MTSDSELYPDVESAGSLAAALEVAAVKLGVDLGNIVSSDSDPLGWAAVASVDARRDPFSIMVGAVERWFIVTGWSRGVELVSGATPDLGEVAKAASAWRRGGRLSEIQRTAPFVEISEKAYAHERGPADVVAVQWRLIRQAARDSSVEGVHALVEAAHARQRLRRLLPVLSHWSLHFSMCTGYPYTWNIPFVDPLGNGRYRVSGPARDVDVDEVDSADAAIALVVARLPAGCGPAVEGTAHDFLSAP